MLTRPAMMAWPSRPNRRIQTCAPIHLNSGLDLAQLSFTLQVSADRFANFVLTPSSPEIGSASIVPSGTDEYQVTLAASPGQVLQLNRDVAQLSFELKAGQASAIVPLKILGLLGARLAGEALDQALAQDGRVTILGPELLLDVNQTSRSLVVYGKTGDHISLEYRADLGPGSIWKSFLETTLQADSLEIPQLQLPQTGSALFIRARKE